MLVIAIVDDDALVRSSMASLIRSFGMVAATFASAEELLDTDAAAFDCIISDVQMGGMTGIELLVELQRRSIATPLILVTAYPNTRLRERALESGARGFLEKPWAVGEMTACLEKIVGPLE